MYTSFVCLPLVFKQVLRWFKNSKILLSASAYLNSSKLNFPAVKATKLSFINTKFATQLENQTYGAPVSSHY
jgi:hypothetical protein